MARAGGSTASITPTSFHGPAELEQAYARVAAELEQVAEARLSPLNVDLLHASSVALAVAERLVPLRDELAKLHDFDLRHIDRLADYARTAWFLHLMRPVPARPRFIAEARREAEALRSKLLVWAKPFVASGVFDAELVASIRKRRRFEDHAADLVALSQLYRGAWERVRGKCDVSEADLTRAAELGPMLFAWRSRREHAPDPELAEHMRCLRRAWTLLDRAYAQCRRAVVYLRFDHGDADQIVPGLRHNKGGTRRATRRTKAGGGGQG